MEDIAEMEHKKYSLRISLKLDFLILTLIQVVIIGL